MQIKPHVNRNRIFSMVAGGTGLCLMMLYVKLAEDPFMIPVYGISGLSIAIFFMGVLKLSEPEFSFELDQEALTHYTRRGNWVLPWTNVIRAGVPNVSVSLERMELPYVAIKVQDYDSLIENMPLRLISHMIMEQRSLVLLGVKAQCQDGDCGSQQLYDDSIYESKDGTIHKGMRAMFGNRMVKLRELYGFDLFIASNSLDRDEQDFAQLINQTADEYRPRGF